MAFKYYVGVVEPLGDHFTTGPSDSTHTNIGELQAGAIRRIWKVSSNPAGTQLVWEHPLTEIKAHCQMLVAHGKYVVPTLNPGSWAIQPGLWKQAVGLFADALQGIVSVIEVGNEPRPQVGDFSSTGTGPYFDRLRDAIPIIHQRNIDVVAAGVPTGNFVPYRQGLQANAATYSPAATSIWSLIDGIGIHPYYATPGTTLSTGMLGWVQDQRTAINAYSAAATALPLFITEFGWNTQGFGAGPTPISEAQQDTYLQQAYTNWVTNAATLKIRVACWFSFTDYSRFGGANPIWDHYCGIRTDIGAHNPVPWRYKNGGGQTGAVGIKATLDSFGAGADLTDPPPVAVTTTATNITKTAARLRGTVNPNGTQTTIAFDYGPTNAYGSTSPPVSVGNGNAAVSGFYDAPSLISDTTYHYRTRAVSSAGTDLGSDVTFKTLVAPQAPVVTTGPATNIKPTGATLTGVIDPNDLSTTWHFEYGPTTSYGTSAPVPDKDL